MSHAEHQSAAPAAAPGRIREHHTQDRHQSFLIYEHFRYLRLAALAVVVSIAIYLADSPMGGRYGGSWAGYILGSAGALLILWLMWFGYRKRSYASNQGKLEAWLSAHVYMGLALVVIATLHTGFHFGWNIHTAAYGLMCLVIASGVFGVFCYVHYPRLMTDNRSGTTMPQILGRIAVLNEELTAAAMTVDDETARIVTRATQQTEIGGTWRQQLSGRYPGCTTATALAHLGVVTDDAEEQAVRKIRVLLDEKAVLLGRARRDLSFKAMMDIWLYFHVPLSFALLAALLAHVISVFFYW